MNHAGSDGSNRTGDRAVGPADQYETIVNSVPDGVYQLDLDGRFEAVNDVCVDLTGYDREDLLGAHVSTVVDEADVRSITDDVREMVTEPSPAARTRTATLHTANDRAMPVEIRFGVLEADGEVRGTVGVVRDRSAAIARERRLEQRDWQFRALVEAVEEYAIFLLDPGGHVRTWNRGAARIKGYDEATIVGEHVSTFYTQSDRSAGRPERLLARAAEAGQATDEGWRVRADGRRFWATVTITALYDDRGDLEGFAKVTRDMTDRHEREEAIRRERDLVARVFETSPVGIALFDAETGELERANAAAADHFDLSAAPEPYVLGSCRMFDERGEPVPVADRPVPRVIDTGEPVADWVGQLERPDGGCRWVSIDATPLKDDDGAVEAVVAAIEDVSALRAKERRLRRQRDDLVHELEEVLGRVSTAFYALDEDWRFTYVNDRAVELLDRPEAELLGRRIWEAFPSIAESRLRTAFETAMDAQDPDEFEMYSESLAGWFEINVHPSESGLSVYLQDVTERVERERQLERAEVLFEHSTDVNAVVAPDGTFEYLSPSVEQVLGYGRDELVGETAFAYVHPADRERLRDQFERVVGGETIPRAVEFRFARADGTWAVMESTARNVLDHPSVGGIAVYTRDVTERVERERQLERYETVVETVDDGIYVVDEEGRFTMVNDTFTEMVGESRAALLGAPASTVVADDVADRARELDRQLREGETETATLQATLPGDGDPIVAEAPFSMLPGEAGHERVAAVRDVTQRVERERELERYEVLMEESTDLNAIVDAEGRCEYLTPSVERVLGYEQGELVGENAFEYMHPDDREATLAAFERVLGEREGRETVTFRFERADGSWATMEATGRNLLEDPNVEGVVAYTRDVTERVERERQLEQQRERLAALDHLNGVVREINRALIGQSSREEMEQAVCERLAASESYAFAWIGEVEPQADTVRVRAEAGVSAFLADMTVSIDPDHPTSDGPTARALRTGEMQVVRDARDDPDYARWRERAEAYGYQASAAIPIVHEDTVYGVLNVYAGRRGAFGGEERAVVGQLGETVGHAIAAIERKRALTSDQVVELEFQVEHILADLGVEETDGTIAFDRTISLGGGDHLAYGTVQSGAVDTLEALADQLDGWTDLTVHEPRFGEAQFELRLCEPPVVSVAAAHGGRVRHARIEDGDFEMVVQLPPSADVRRVTEAVRSAYAELDVVAQRRTRRAERTTVRQTIAEELTDRQRAALEAAYQAGFFDWPRRHTGEEVAASLDISPATFHEHLRNGERKLLAGLLETDRAGA